jgi:hypothetical protein
VPTELADKLWHAHILSTRDYIAMCDKVSGSYLHHQPGMQKGTVEHTVAMKRTRELHHHIRRAGKTPGFDENYFAELDPKPVPRAAPKARSRSRDTSSDGGVHGTAIDPFLPAHTGDTTPIENNEHSSSFGGGSSGGGGASGGWGDSSSSNSSDSGSDSSSSDSGGGGGCGGSGD